MASTSLLPPMAAIRMAWAITGKFSNDEHSRTSALYAEDALKRIEDRSLLPQTSPEEMKYITSAVASVKASLRSLETAYKGRDLNFKENEKIRTAYLEAVGDSIAFGNKAKDFLKSVPSMTIGAAGGITVGEALNLSSTYLWLLGLGLAAIGYIVNLGIVRLARRRTQMLYVTQDYERGLYFEQYVNRCRTILLGLYLELERTHSEAYGTKYNTGLAGKPLEQEIDAILAGVHATFCKYVHKHIKENRVTPELWPLCETGHPEGVQKCPEWKREGDGTAPS